jgi:hypothetical protein
MNRFLFYSSLVYGVLLIAVLLVFPITDYSLALIILAGILTSLWNHGSMSAIAHMCDRTVMVLGTVLVLLLCVQIKHVNIRLVLLLLLLTTLGLYGAAKLTDSTACHFTAHTVLTGIFILLIERHSAKN